MPSRSTRGRNRQPAATSDEYPNLLKGTQGNIVWKEGEVIQNSVGMTNVAKAAVNILRHLVNAEGAIDEEDFQQIKQFRRLFNLTPTPNQRKKPRLRLIDELEAEEDSDLDVGRRATRLSIDYPYIIQDMWTVDGERVIVSVLYAANQALPLYSVEVAQAGGSNITLATSMAYCCCPH
ncbi:hypothetical protein V8C43DRAFT_320918 [Trichoderma afarasin]